MSIRAHAQPALRLQCTLVALPHSLRSYLLRLVTKLPSARTKLEVGATARNYRGIPLRFTQNCNGEHAVCNMRALRH